MSKFIEVKEITLESGDQHYRVNYPSNGIFLVNIKDDKAFFSVTDNEVLWIGSADSFTFVDAPDIVSPTNEVKEVQPSEGKVENTPETPSSGGIKVTMVEQGCKKCSEIYGLLNHGILKKCPSCGDNISYASVVYSNGDREISFIEKEETPTNWYVENDLSDELLNAISILAKIKRVYGCFENGRFIHRSVISGHLGEVISWISGDDVPKESCLLSKEQVIKMAEDKKLKDAIQQGEKVIVDYKIAYSDSYTELSDYVTRYIKEGWQPYGYLTNAYNNLLQVMVKYGSAM